MQPTVSYCFSSCYMGCRTHAGCKILHMSPLRCNASGNPMIWLCANASCCFDCIIRDYNALKIIFPQTTISTSKSIFIRFIRSIRVPILGTLSVLGGRFFGDFCVFGGQIKNRAVGDGGDLLSHTVARAVPSAQASLTSVFGMGTGVTSLL